MFREGKTFIVAGVVLVCVLMFIGARYLIVSATTNISAVTAEHFSWDDITGWWDFFATNNIDVQNTKIAGYASSSFGYISFDCLTSPNGNICSSGNGFYGVCNGPGPREAGGTCPNATANGELSGWAWSDEIGWISFNCADLGICGVSNYGVSIDSNGDFNGYAWNDVVGWISFNCTNYSGCGTSNYKVKTSWAPSSSIGYLESSIFDTERIAGGLLNSIVWQGTSPGAESCVSFQIAASNSAGGPWSYKGPSGDSTSYYSDSCANAPNGGGAQCTEDNTPICVDKTQFTNYRYLRYKVKIQSTLSQDSPEITDIILNWSP